MASSGNPQLKPNPLDALRQFEPAADEEYRLGRGDEITIDYRLNAFDGNSWPCACGAENCTGTVVGSFFAIPPERQAAYVRFAPPFIKREYRRRAGR